jgi:excisionase family DNA binding protein
VKIAPHQLLTSTEVGQLLQMNASSVKKWIDDGLIRAFRTPGGHRRIRGSDLVVFLEGQNMPVPPELTDLARRRVLVVDDDPALLKAVARALKRHTNDSVEVRTAQNGIDALVLVGSFRPSWVVLDMLMPGIDGLEVCRRLHASHKRELGVIAVSGHWTAPLERKALQAGAVRCLDKPLDARGLAAIVASTPIEVRSA